MDNWAEYLKFFAGLLAIINPVGAVPLFINLTQNETRRERRRTALIAGLTVAIVLLVALFVGESLLRFFGITVPSFRVAGGILILLMALAMLQARTSPVKQTEEEAQEGVEKPTVGVVPLGLPLLAGPGAISTVILYGGAGQSFWHYAVLAGAILLVAAIAWAFMRAAPYVSDLLGKTGINIVTRIMGLIMAAIGVEFIANGMRGLFPALGG